MNNKTLHMIAWILLIIGGLNWGAMGLLSWGIGSFLSDNIAQIVYILVGLAALYELFTHKANCKMCAKGGAAPSPASGGGM